MILKNKHSLNFSDHPVLLARFTQFDWSIAGEGRPNGEFSHKLKKNYLKIRKTEGLRKTMSCFRIPRLARISAQRLTRISRRSAGSRLKYNNA